jgi:solute carrier family 35 protein E3
MGSIVFMNLSLSHNSVAFYQLSKLAWTPVTLGLEYCLFRTKVSRRVFLALLTIILGVGIATIKNAIVADLKGIILAVVAVLFSATGQILCSHYQKQKGYDSIQLYCSVCPLVMMGTFVSIPIFHNIKDLRQSHLSMSLTMHILLSCVLALGVNITNYLVLGQTSPITYQVLGHLKTVSVLLLGFVFFNDRCNKRMTGGIILALAGVMLYSEQKRRDCVASLPNDESFELISKSPSPLVVSEKAFEE